MRGSNRTMGALAYVVMALGMTFTVIACAVPEEGQEPRDEGQAQQQLGKEGGGEGVCYCLAADGSTLWGTASECAASCPPYDPTACGDGNCADGETRYNCPIDCGPAEWCGDGICNNRETSYNCSTDCGPPPAAPVCGDGSCAYGENCLADCGRCGDCVCDPWEHLTCTSDCNPSFNETPSSVPICGSSTTSR